MRRLAGILLVVVMVLLAEAAAAAAPARIAFVYDGGESTGAGELLRAAAPLTDVAHLTVYAAGDGGRVLHDEAKSPLAEQDLVFIDGAAQSARSQVEWLADLAASTRLVVVNPSHGLAGNVSLTEHPALAAYWREPSQDNYAGLIRYLAQGVLGHAGGTPVPAPISYPPQGFYHPNAPHAFRDWSAYRTWAISHVWKDKAPSAVSVAIVFHRNYYLHQDLAVVNALIEAVEAEGQRAVPVFYDGDARLADALSVQGVAQVDAVLFQGDTFNRQDREAGLAQARRLGVPVLSAINDLRSSPDDYRVSAHGLAPAQSGNIAHAERNGIFEPIAVGAAGERDYGRRGMITIEGQPRWRAQRAIAWARLHRKANADKKVVFTFWSESGGKADLGGDPDDFLDVPGSLIRLLKVLRERGYDVGEAPLPSRDELAARLAREASNVGNWAPRELAKRAGDADSTRMPLSDYLNDYRHLPATLRGDIEAVWGAPPGDIMVTGEGNDRSLVFPGLRFGHILIAPHPAWGYLQNERALKGSAATPPHHQYLAFFLWLQHGFKADAWVSLFTNIVLQPGKSEGPLADDAIGVLLGALPHIHAERLGAGGIANKRKALALTPDWYNLVVPTGELTTMTPLEEMLARYDTLSADQNLRAGARQAIRAEVVKQRLDRALGVDAENEAFDRLRQRVSAYLGELSKQNLPYGTKVLGQIPAPPALAGMVDAMLANNGFPSHRPERSSWLEAVVAGQSTERILADIDGNDRQAASAMLDTARDFADRLRSAPREVEAILEALEGQHIEPGPMSSPLRDPDALPVGRNLYAFDPALLPTREAEEAGARAAHATVRAFRDDHDGAFPQRLAYVLFASETTRTQGVTEAEILSLLGVRAMRDHRGRVTGVGLIDRATLGRPRVDVTVTTSGTYRDHFSAQMNLIDRAVRLAATSPEADNPIAAAARLSQAESGHAGTGDKQAANPALARVFSTAPGAYSPNIQFLARSGDRRGDESDMAELYRHRLGHVYGEGYTGEARPQAFSEALKGLQGAVLPRSGDVNGMLDQPMSAAYLGGLDLASRAAGGQGVSLYVSRPGNKENPTVESAAQAIQSELNTRYFNPQWIKRMQEHGYDGARTFLFLTDNLDLWDSSAGGTVSSDDWAQVKAVYVDDRYQLDMHRFLDQHNPYAEQGLLANLLDASARGHWQASEADRRQVAKRLVDSALAHGSVCNAQLCRNPRLTDMIEKALQGTPDGAELAQRYRQTLAAATGAAPGAQPAPALPAPASPATAGAAPTTVTGQVLETVSQAPTSATPVPSSSLYACLFAALLLMVAGFLFGDRSGFTSGEPS